MYHFLRSDDARAASKRRVVHDPLKQNHHAIAKTDQEKEMQDKPHEPGEPAGKLQLANRGDGREASHRGHIPFIDVMNRLAALFSSDPVSNDASHIAPLLDRYLGHSRQWLPIPILCK